MSGLRLVPGAREALRGPVHHPRQAARVGVEEEVHRGLVLGPQRRVPPVAVPPALGDRGVIGDVAGGLLQIGGEPPALEHLRHDVRHPFAGDVGAAELRHGIVAVAEEDPPVEPGGAIALLAVECPRDAGLEVAGELVEEQPPQRALVARVAREQRPLHRLRQVHQGEHRPVEVGEVGRQSGALLVREGLDGVFHEGPG